MLGRSLTLTINIIDGVLNTHTGVGVANENLVLISAHAHSVAIKRDDLLLGTSQAVDSQEASAGHTGQQTAAYAYTSNVLSLWHVQGPLLVAVTRVYDNTCQLGLTCNC